MNDARSSLIGWYRISGFFLNMEIVVTIKMMMSRTKENVALMIKKAAPEMLTPISGIPKGFAHKSKIMAFTKLMEQIEILMALVLLSIQGRIVDAAMSAAASI